MLQDVSLAERSAPAPTDVTEPLILDFLHWLSSEPRRYADVMEVWRTSCPRLTIWEDCVDRGLVERRRADQQTLVVLTELGRQRLARSRSPL
jgi:hypothetical protein